MMNGLCRENLFNIINEASFAMDECTLFLDTHPDSIEALDFYQKCKCLRKEAWDEYTKNYGPLSAYDVNVEDVWTWNAEPLPWE